MFKNNHIFYAFFVTENDSGLGKSFYIKGHVYLYEYVVATNTGFNATLYDLRIL